MNTQRVYESLDDTTAKHEEQAGGDHDRGGNIADARVNRRRNGGGQAGIQYAFDAETEPRDNPPRRDR